MIFRILIGEIQELINFWANSVKGITQVFLSNCSELMLICGYVFARACFFHKGHTWYMENAAAVIKIIFSDSYALYMYK